MTCPTKKLGDVLEKNGVIPAKIKRDDYRQSGKYPVVDQGENLIAGYIDDEQKLYRGNLPVIVFGDHTRIVKYIDFPFAFGADGIKILKPQEILLAKFFYYTLILNPVENQGYKRHFSLLARIKISILPLKIQKQIVERMDKIVEAQKLNDELIQKSDELFQSLLHKELNLAGKDWGVKRLKDVCEINPGKTETNKLSEETIVCFLAMADVSENAEIINWQERKLGEVKKGFTFFKNGDVLVAKITPCFENGKGALIEDMKSDFGFGSTEFHVLRASAAILLNQFLYYLVSDKKFRKLGAKFMTGSAGQQRVPIHYLENFKISLPPLQTQKQIVAKLSAAQEYKKQLLEQKKKLKELFDSVLHKSTKDPIIGALQL